MRIKFKDRNKDKKIAGDIIIILILLAVAFLIWLLTVDNNGNELTATIYINNDIYLTINLNEVEEAYEINLNESNEVDLYNDMQQINNVIIQIEPGKIRFKESYCSNKYCINTGWLDKASKAAICAPAGSAVIVTANNSNNKEGDGPDAIAG